MNLSRVEHALKERWQYPYVWGRKQSNTWDRMSNFIYTSYSVRTVLKKAEPFGQALQHYALTRWYNFWSAMAVEEIFASHPNVVANKNRYDKLIDFTIDGIPFDHKTSVYPKGFPYDFAYAKQHPEVLIEWLYRNQSQQGRKHMKNRLFIVLYDPSQEHWKMKAEINMLKEKIDHYIDHFSPETLYTFDFGEGKVYADILWITK